jgi:hypothetical protein
MGFKYYCIVVMGETKGVLNEIADICNDDPKVLDAKGILICTFNSATNAKEMEDYFTSLGRSFFLFEIGAKNTGYNIVNKTIREGLFSHIESDLNDLPKKSKSLFDELQNGVFEPLPENIKQMLLNNSGTTKEHNPEQTTNIETVEIKGKLKINQSYYNKLSEKERDNIINNIIDKGFSNLTDLDKEILDFLSKKR